MYFLSALQVLAYGSFGRSEISTQKHSRQTKGNHGYKELNLVLPSSTVEEGIC